MEATELRLNNLLMYDDIIVPIIGMENSSESVLVKINPENAVDYKKLKPIALTAEWFSKLGFKEAYRSPTRIRFDLPNYCRYDFDLDSNKILEGFCSLEIISNAATFISYRISITHSPVKN